MYRVAEDDLQESPSDEQGMAANMRGERASSPTPALHYRPDIDGLRAIAVLSVVLFHAGLGVFSGGYVGVDVFFVISGYLITTIVSAQVARGNFSVGDFYDRRIRRIFPALYTVVLASLVAGWVWMMPFDLQGFGSNLAAMAGFASNFYFCKTGYFDGGADIMPLMHTWSLAVEEQFYIVFPLLFAFLARRGERSTRWGLALLLTASLVANLVGLRGNAKFAFYMPWQRAWELLSGSMLALGLIPRVSNRAAREALAIVGLVAIAWAVFAYDGNTPFPGEAALLPVLGTALLIHTGGRGSTWVARLLSTRAAVSIGLASYSLYLWHWPIFVFARYRLMREMSEREGLMFSGLALLFAYLSWRFVERPFRHGDVLARKRVFVAGFACSALTALIGAGLYYSQGVPQRLAEPVRALAMAAFDENPNCSACHNHTAAQVDADDVCTIGNAEHASFVVLGDSFADALMPGIAAAAEHAGLAGYVITKGGCAPLLGVGSAECRALATATQTFLARHPRVDTVLMSARWSGFAEGARFGENRPKVIVTDALSVTPGPEDNRRVLRAGFERTLAALAPRHVAVIAFSPEQELRPPRALALQLRYALPGVMGVDRATYDARQRSAHAIIDPLAARPRVSVIDLGPALCDDLRCPGARAGVVLYSDDNHVSRSGALAVEGTLARAFTR